MKVVSHKFDNRLYIKDMPIPNPKADEILIKVSYGAICHDDMTIISNSGSNNMRYDRTNLFQSFGHEASGKIVALGKDISPIDFPIDSPVAIRPIAPCGNCYYCKNSKENLCVSAIFYGGLMKEYTCVHHKQVLLLPQNIPLIKACLTEPIAATLHAVNKANISFGDSVAVIGNGIFPLLMLQLLRNMGASKIVAIGVDDSNLEIAKKYSDQVYSSRDKNALIHAINQTNNTGFNSVIEASGNRFNKQDVIPLLSRSGTIVFFSLIDVNTDLRLNLFELFWQEITIKGSYHYTSDDFQNTINYMNKLDLDPFIQNIYSITEVQKAYEDMYYGKTLKSIISFN